VAIVFIEHSGQKLDLSLFLFYGPDMCSFVIIEVLYLFKLSTVAKRRRLWSL